MRALACLAILVSPPVAQAPVAELVDPVFAEFDSTTSPGCSVGVFRDGEIAYARGYGMADLEHGVPIEPRSIFRIASTSKQFTAATVVLLHLRGDLSLDDDIRKWLPEMRDYGQPITIRHLIHHTSGIRDYLTLMSLAGKGGADFYTDAEVLAAIARQRELNFEPGSRFLYSNSGYFLLGQIVARTTGKSLRVAARELIFEPLGMRNTHFHDDHTELVRHRAEGYARAEGGYRISRTTLEMIGDGGVFTCIDDLLAWDRNFYEPKVGGEEFLELMHATGTLTSGEALDYAAGLRVSTYRGLPTVSHGGAFVGYRAEMLRFPKQRLTIACLANVSAADPATLCRRVADALLAGQLQPPTNEASRAQSRRSRAAQAREDLSEDEAQAVIGRYFSDEIATTWTIAFTDGRLRLRYGRDVDRELVSRGEGRFTAGRITLRFSADREQFLADSGRVRNLRFVRRHD